MKNSVMMVRGTPKLPVSRVQNISSAASSSRAMPAIRIFWAEAASCMAKAVEPLSAVPP